MGYSGLESDGMRPDEKVPPPMLLVWVLGGAAAAGGAAEGVNWLDTFDVRTAVAVA